MRVLSLRRKRGFGLTELAVVLGVVGILLGGIWAAISTVQERNNIYATLKMVTLTVDNIRTLYPGNRQFTGALGTPLDTALAGAGVFPPDVPIWQGNADMRANLWGGRWRIRVCQPGSCLFPDQRHFRIYSHEIPLDICRKLQLQSLDIGAVSVEVLIGGSNVRIPPDRIGVSANGNIVAAACEPAANGLGKIDWEFALHNL